MPKAEAESLSGEKKILNLPENTNKHAEIEKTQVESLDELKNRIGTEILDSMNSVNIAGAHLINKMDNSEDYNQVLGLANGMAKLIESQAKLIGAVGVVVRGSKE